MECKLMPSRPEVRRARERAQYARDPERRARLRDAVLRFHERNPGRAAEYTRAWRAKHPARWREMMRRASHAWYQRDPDHARALGVARENRRRVLQIGNGGSHTSEEWREKMALLGGCCVYCGRDDVPLTRDHKIPLSRGGTDDITNIVPACLSCNSSKHDRTATEHLAKTAVA